METLILPSINVLALFWLLAYFTGKPLKAWIKNRTQSINEGLSRAKVNVLSAENQRAEVEKKFAGIEKEKENIFFEWQERQKSQIKGIEDAARRLRAQMELEAKENQRALEETLRREAIKTIALETLTTATARLKNKLNPDLHQSYNDLFEKELMEKK